MSIGFGNGLNCDKTVTQIKDYNGNVVGTFSVTKSKKKKMKKLNYHHKELSARVLRSNSVGSARAAMTAIQHKTAVLQKQLRSGEYQEREVRSAIAHAQKMERAARKRMKHFEQEDEQRTKQHKKMRQNAAQKKQEEMQLEAYLRELKKKHRREENQDVVKADLNYLREKLEQLEKESQENPAEAGAVALELSGMDMTAMVQEAVPPIPAEGANVDLSL